MLLGKEFLFWGKFVVSTGRCFLGKDRKRQKKTWLLTNVLIICEGGGVKSLAKKKC